MTATLLANNISIQIPIINKMMNAQYGNLQESMMEVIDNAEQSYAILLVNSRSGSRVGDSLIKQNNKQIRVRTSAQIVLVFTIYDLYSAQQRSNAFKYAKQKMSCKKTVYVISCGGDGTVQWAIDEAIKSQINLQDIIFSVLPIGTGNDFAKSVGWGDFQFSNKQQKFQQLAQQITKCKLGNFDIWECAIQCYDNGLIVQIKNGEQMQRNQNKLTKNFTNYFGIGTDAQICYLAQKLNAKTIAWKKIAYGFAGFLSFWMFCGGLKRKIAQILQYNNEQKEQTISQISQKQSQTQPKSKLELLQKINISRFDCCVAFLNTTSSMDLQGIWQTPYRANSNVKNEDYKKQVVNDGLIQIVSYTNQISLWFERFWHMAKKVGQGNGPFIINFKQPKDGKFQQIFIHINGQPYKLVNARSIIVSQSPQFPQGKIRVLFRSKK